MRFNIFSAIHSVLVPRAVRFSMLWDTTLILTEDSSFNSGSISSSFLEQRTLLLLCILELPKARLKKCGLLFSNYISVFARVQIKSGNVFLPASLFLLLICIFQKKSYFKISKHMRELVEFYWSDDRLNLFNSSYLGTIKPFRSASTQTTRRVWQEILLDNKPVGEQDRNVYWVKSCTPNILAVGCLKSNKMHFSGPHLCEFHLLTLSLLLTC